MIDPVFAEALCDELRRQGRDAGLADAMEQLIDSVCGNMQQDSGNMFCTNYNGCNILGIL